MGSSFGRFLTVTTFGESHGAAVGVVIDGVPAGTPLDEAVIQRQLDRRKPGTSAMVSARREPDGAEILSGVRGGLALGSPVTVLVRNQDVRSQDYEELSDLFRPGHADYTYFEKYGLAPQPGGGRSSGRETVGRVAAGAVARVLLDPWGVTISGAAVRVGEVEAREFDPEYAETSPLRFADPSAGPRAEALVRRVASEGDSIGGVVEVRALGLPAGWGDPVFDKLDAALAGALMSIGGVKGVEIGSGFQAALRRGGENNDQMNADGFLSNHAGGVLGGISTGQPLIVRLAVKPTSSIARTQSTVDLKGRPREIRVGGRHDPCLCPRIVPVAEAMTALVLADAMFEQAARRPVIS